MPLTEFLAVMFFDGGAYTIRAPATKLIYRNAVLALRDRYHAEADVGLMNALQALAADDVLYFGDKDAADYVERLHSAHCRTSGTQTVVARTAWREDGRSELTFQPLSA